MNPLTLQRLWSVCIALVVVLLLVRFIIRKPAARDDVQPAITAAPPVEPQVQNNGQEKPQTPSYSYVGEAAPAAAPAKKADSDPAPMRPPDQAAQSDSHENAKQGDVPDLVVDLGNHEVMDIVRRFGLIPAVKSRTRVLGKIVGNRFFPLSRRELRRYAHRARAGDAYPQAGRWLRRVAAELGLPHEDLRLILLVPRNIESRFLMAQRQALHLAGRSAREIALMRGYYDESFDIVITEMVSRSGGRIHLDTAETAR